MSYQTFEQRRAAALAHLGQIRADAQLLHDILGRVKNVRCEGWCQWARPIETAFDALGVAVADVTRNAELT